MSRKYKILKRARDDLFELRHPGWKSQPGFTGNSRQRRVARRKVEREGKDAER